MLYGLSIILNLFWLLILAGIFYVVYRLVVKKGAPENKKENLHLAATESAFLLAACLLGATLALLNQNIGKPANPETILLLAVIAAIFTAYYYRLSATLLIGIGAVYIWWSAQVSDWTNSRAMIISGIAAITAIYYLLSGLHFRQLKNTAFYYIYLIISSVTILGLLTALSSSQGLEMLETSSKPGGDGGGMIAGALIAFLAAVFVLGSYYNLNKKNTSIYEISFFIIVISAILAAGLASGPELVSGYGYSNREFSGTGIILAALFNLLAFAGFLGFIFTGYQRQDLRVINIGTFLLFLFIISKYFDWFFKFLDKSLFFIIAGVLMVGLGWFMEKGRRRLINTLPQ
jgi:uncharacterized membrane protein